MSPEDAPSATDAAAGGRTPAVPLERIPRPFDVADLLDRAVDLYRESFLSVFLLPLCSGTVYFVLSRAAFLAGGVSQLGLSGLDETAGGDSVQDMGRIALVTTAVTLAGLLLNVWATGALVEALSSRLLGRPTTFGDAARRGLRRLPALVGTSLVVWLALVCALTAFTLPLVLVAFVPPATRPIAGLVALAVGVPVTLVALLGVLRMWLHPAAVVVEERGPFAALRRSATLMRRRVGPGLAGRNDVRLSIVLLVLPAIAIAVQMLASVPALIVVVVGGIAEFVDGADLAGLPQWAEGPLVATQVAGNALIQPFAVATTLLFYYDLRCRTEGYDLELRAHALLAAAAPPAAGPR